MTTPRLTFDPLEPSDLQEMDAQPSQAMALGLPLELNDATCAELAGQEIAWCAHDGERIVACFGIVETFAGRQGWGWALLAENVRDAHLQLTRHMRSVIENCGLARLEVLAQSNSIEDVLRAKPDVDSGQAVALAMSLAKPTPECRWAEALGLTAAHVLRCFGAQSETYMLFERVDPAALQEREAA